MRRKSFLIGAGLLLLSPAFAFSAQPGKCRTITEVTVSQMLSTSPARVCSVELSSTSSTAVAYIFDAVSLAATRKGLAEPSVVSQNTFINFGDQGFVTEEGLGVDLDDGSRVIIRWSG